MAIERATGRITWTPTTAQIGEQNVAIRVLDGRGGEATQTFMLSVVADTGNRAPRIISPPLLTGATGELYRYAAVATDLDNDPLAFDLVVAPPGMTIDPASGLIVWRPLPENVGDNNVILRVRDGRGGVHLQPYQAIVTAPGSAPCFSTPPPTVPAAVGQPYQYQFRTQDADGDTVSYRLDDFPAGMTIDPTTGLLHWTPETNQVGSHNVIVTATDASGARVRLSFTLQVLASASNDSPAITSSPRTSIGLGATYLYQLAASDPNNDPLIVTLQSAPAGMTIDADGSVRWDPVTAQLGASDVVIRVEDGRGGVVSQSFTVDVTTERANQLPQIISTPLLVATVGRDYHHEERGVDPDADPLVWSLATSPEGMSIHATLGTLCWTPTADQVGRNPVVIQLDDGQGGLTTQSFTVVVRAVNLPPAVVSTPPTQAAVSESYAYALRAEDPEGDPLNFALTAAPAGMTIDAATGLIAWTPTAAQPGSQNVAVEVTDGQGGSATQTFTIVVAPAPPNQPPIITSRPLFAASVGLPYVYDVDATDPDGDALVFALDVLPAGMTIDSASGLITWTPTADQVGSQLVALHVTDGNGSGAGEIYRVSVQPANRPPIINSTAVLSTTAGLVYRYDVDASDPDGNALNYSLTSPPAGMTIDTLGRITWSTAVPDIGPHPITVVVTDSFGASATQSFDLTVSADTQPPNAIVDFNSPVAVGTEVLIFVSATDNVGVANLSLTVGGTPLTIDANGQALFQATSVGSFTVLARAVDAAGNAKTTTDTLLVIDPTDADAPVAIITSPSDEAVITSPTPVIGTVSDANLVQYTLSLALLGSSDFVEFARGATSVINGVLGTLDPTLLNNDTYVLRLEALDAGGHVATLEHIVHIKGQLKLGNFNLSFTDLTVPVFGIPITVARTYDTLTASQSRDFGFGWRLEFRNMNLRTSVRPTGLEEYGIFNPFKTGSRVYLTLPGGERQGFTFRPQVAAGFRGSFVGIFEPRFVPDAGVKSSLTVTPADLRFSADGRVFDFSTGIPYNPANSAFGGSYLLTTKEGIAYDVDGRTGQLTSLSDPTDNVLTFTDAGITGPEGKSIAFERDPQGRITAVVDPAGQRIRYQYDARGDLIGVTDRTNNQTQFAYRSTPAHYLETIIDPLGRTGVRTEYDAQGRLIKIFDAAGNPAQFTYDPAQLVNTVTDALGNTTTEVYDERGNTLRRIDALGGITLRTFDADNNQLSETNPLGHTTTFTYNDRGDALTQTDPLGNASISTYQTFTFGTTSLAAIRGEASAPFTRMTTVTDAIGNTTTIAYNSFGSLTTTSDSAGNITTLVYDRPSRPPVSMMDALGNVTTFETVNGLLVREVDPLGHALTYTYDENGNRLTSTSSVTAADGSLRSLATATEYDGEGRVIEVTDAEGGVTRTEYDAAGNRTAKIDALGRRTVYRYDTRDLLIETIYPDETPHDISDNPRTKSEYDAAGQETARIDELGRRTEYRYDALGNPTRTDYPDNSFTRTENDALRQITAQIDGRGNRTEFEYDANGRQTVTRDALGNSTSFTYDQAGRRVAATDALNHSTNFVYDAIGQLIETRFADGTRATATYDMLNRVVSQTDQMGRTKRFEYDALGRTTAVEDALSQRTVYAYDEAGNQNKNTDANGQVTRYEFDRLGRQTAVVLPQGQRSETTFDAVGNFTAIKDFNGATIAYTYDARDRLTSKSFSSGASVTYAYTPTGQLDAVTDFRGLTNYDYDLRDRLLSRTDPDGARVSYFYDPHGNRTSLTASVGAASLTTTYTFDMLNRLETVTDPNLGVTRYTYDAAGNLTRTEFPNATIETRSYDRLNRLLYLENRGPTGVISSHRYTLAPTGRRDAVVDHDGRRVDYAYDALDRITREVITDAVLGDRTFDYTYDAVGNRLTRNDSVEGLTTYSYDANDRLLTELALDTGLSTTTSYTYDNNGNLLSRTSATDQVFYNWDFENRLVSVDTNGDGTIDVRNEYDHSGIRVSQTVSGQETRFLIDTVRPFVQVLLEYRPSGLVVASYVYGPRLISQSRSGTNSFYHADGVGSVRALTDATGAVTDSYINDAFGATLSSLGTTINNYQYLGEQFDPSLNLVYLRARYLSPDIGRFVSADPFPGFLSDPMTLHRFLYAAADPVNRIDPSGLLVITIELSISAAISGILRGLGSVVVADIGNDIGGIPGAIIGAIGGFVFFGRFGSWLVRNPATVAPKAVQTAKQTAAVIKQNGSSYAYKKLLTINPKGQIIGVGGKKASLAVVPIPAYTDIFKATLEGDSSGQEALCLLDGHIRELADQAGDPATAEYFYALAASIRAATGENPCPSMPDA
jgi:RHS repeat-associated protein